MAMKIESHGWVCQDCLLILANDDDSGIEDGLAHRARMARYDPHNYYLIVIGGEHDEDCPNMRDGEWVGDTDCNCETREFSRSTCDTCGTTLAGSRHAITYLYGPRHDSNI